MKKYSPMPNFVSSMVFVASEEAVDAAAAEVAAVAFAVVSSSCFGALEAPEEPALDGSMVPGTGGIRRVSFALSL